MATVLSILGATYFGLSTDQKPFPDTTTGQQIVAGSRFYELDSRRWYVWDGANNWVEQDREAADSDNLVALSAEQSAMLQAIFEELRSIRLLLSSS